MASRLAPRSETLFKYRQNLFPKSYFKPSGISLALVIIHAIFVLIDRFILEDADIRTNEWLIDILVGGFSLILFHHILR